MTTLAITGLDSTVAIETDRYLSVSGKLDTSGIDWAQAKREGLSADEVFTLTYFSDIEGQTVMYLRDLLSTEAALESDVIAFLTMWNYEEFFHGKALAQLLEECGHGLEQNRIASVRKSRSVSEILEGLGAVIISKIFSREFPAVHATWGAVQEITTLRGYERLGALTHNSALKVLCERIAKQERRHFAWYFNSARERLQRSERSRWLTRKLLSRFWTPVGAGVKPHSEVSRLIQLLFGGKDAEALANDIDDKIGSLPGLEGIELMRRFLQQNVNLKPRY